MKVLKFGGKSLDNGVGIENCLGIIESQSNQAITVVVSARGKSTDTLLNLLELAVNGASLSAKLQEFERYQLVVSNANIVEEMANLKSILEAVTVLREFSNCVRDQVLAVGEVVAAKVVTALLDQKGLSASFVDARDLIIANLIEGEVVVDHDKSKSNVLAYYQSINNGLIPIVTGFIGSNNAGSTITLGRNGSNYTATLIANYIGATEVQNWTDVDGVFTANPALVKSARKISMLSYREANELANFGASVLHAKTILPLIEPEIPIRILNTFNPENSGTTIQSNGNQRGIKAVTVIEDVALVSLEGRGLMGRIGIDARIFSALSANSISVRIISQASSERGIGFVVNKGDAVLAKICLEKEFSSEIQRQEISSIEINTELAVIAIIGRHNYALEKAIKGLRRNKIWMHLINNSINGEHISLVVSDNDLRKAVNVVHNHVFGAVRTLNIVAFGKGTVGGTFIDQVIGTSDRVLQMRNMQLKVVGIADSKKFAFYADGFDSSWRDELSAGESGLSVEDIVSRIEKSDLENVVFVDNTASESLSESYPMFINSGIDIVASNKIANSSKYEFYAELRREVRRRGKNFLYETNVGAGLPLIDTIRQLHHSSDQINKIRGVFSGSLSFIFNEFSKSKKPFSEILEEAGELGLTEPDPREDLSGKDVARKLLILARELDMTTELVDVEIANLIPECLRGVEHYSDFTTHLASLDSHYEKIRNDLKPNEVLRYVGELEVGGLLKVNLIKADANTSLGNLEGSDSIFEIYSEGYGNRPVIIQGAGAGADVTARGVYSDVLRVGDKQA